MSNLVVFNSVSLDGYVTDAKADMNWAHQDPHDREWGSFVEGNARGGGILVFGRVTYDMMAAWWPTPAAEKAMPAVAERMNALPKIVFSRSMTKAEWANTRLVTSDIAGEIRRLKKGPEDMAIMGSASIVAQMAQEGLIDVVQMVLVPVVLGSGRTMFDGVTRRLAWKRTSTRAFANGCLYITYEPR